MMFFDRIMLNMQLFSLSIFQLKDKDWDTVRDYVFFYSRKLVVAVIIVALGLWFIRLLIKGLDKIMIARDADASLRTFIRSISSVALKIMLFITAVSVLGFNTTSFVAALGAAGLAIGLALQGSLSNFAGGVLILLFKPFRVGDFISAQGHSGSVKEINILYTTLTTSDNKQVTIPNGILANKDVVNFSAMDTRRVEIKLFISYASSASAAKDILHRLAETDNLVLPEPAPIIGVHELTDKAVGVVFWIWVKRENYLGVMHGMNEKIKAEFEDAGINLRIASLEEQININ